ncbi:MAG: beta-eliminating lyase-related protein, partial [Planctomycetota bacterium]
MCPAAREALLEADLGTAAAYGADTWTEHAINAIRERFETDCQVHFTFNGTAANSLALASICQSYHAVVAHRHSHVNTDECGAPEFFSGGAKLLPVGGADGKIDVDEVDHLVQGRRDVHVSKPAVLSVTQSTEFGTVYSLPELEAICETANRHR